LGVDRERERFLVLRAVQQRRIVERSTIVAETRDEAVEVVARGGVERVRWVRPV